MVAGFTAVVLDAPAVFTRTRAVTPLCPVTAPAAPLIVALPTPSNVTVNFDGSILGGAPTFSTTTSPWSLTT